MIDNFKLFGIEHVLSILGAVVIGLIFILLAKKYDKKKIRIILAITIILIRSVRYVFDINLGVFSILDLFSLHICNIDLILLVICLFKPNKKIFTFIRNYRFLLACLWGKDCLFQTKITPFKIKAPSSLL